MAHARGETVHTSTVMMLGSKGITAPFFLLSKSNKSMIPRSHVYKPGRESNLTMGISLLLLTITAIM